MKRLAKRPRSTWRIQVDVILEPKSTLFYRPVQTKTETRITLVDFSRNVIYTIEGLSMLLFVASDGSRTVGEAIEFVKHRARKVPKSFDSDARVFFEEVFLEGLFQTRNEKSEPTEQSTKFMKFARLPKNSRVSSLTPATNLPIDVAGASAGTGGTYTGCSSTVFPSSFATFSTISSFATFS